VSGDLSPVFVPVDLIAFAHDREMRKTVTIDQVPKRWRKKLAQ